MYIFFILSLSSIFYRNIKITDEHSSLALHFTFLLGNSLVGVGINKCCARCFIRIIFVTFIFIDYIHIFGIFCD